MNTNSKIKELEKEIEERILFNEDKLSKILEENLSASAKQYIEKLILEAKLEALKLAEQEKEKERKEILEFLKWLIEDKNVEISHRVPEWVKTNIQERINYLEETMDKNKMGCGK